MAPLIPIPALLREADIEPDEVLSEVGLLLGQRSGLSTLGTVGYLMRSSPDVAAFRISSAPR